MGIWAGIKYALNSTLGTKNFMPLDKLVTAHGVQEFTSSGTFVVPDGVHKIWVTACGGGGGGGGYDNETTDDYYTCYGAGGGGAACVVRRPFAVTPGQEIAITIGSGGAKGGSAANGSAGGSTVIGDLITLAGGKGGGGKGFSNSTFHTLPGGDGGGAGGRGYAHYYRSLTYDTGTTLSESGQDGALGVGGKAYACPWWVDDTDGANHWDMDWSYTPGGGGGGGSIGNGGDGAYESKSATAPGHGGGGGGGYSSTYTASKGGSGIAIIEW